MNQNPSPMVERVRRHERIPNRAFNGIACEIHDLLPNPAKIYIPEHALHVGEAGMLLHLHGMDYVAREAVDAVSTPLVLAAANLGTGSAVYQRSFRDPAKFGELISEIERRVAHKTGIAAFREVYLSAFSAGYGAVRAILDNHENRDRVSGLILLDGLHTGYVPERTVLAEGGKLDNAGLTCFLEYARRAADGETRFLVTHSEVFPGTFASTTETVGYLVDSLGLQRKAVLKWGPVGMQQISETSAGNLRILGFAGNSAPDHVDHLHGLPHFLKMLVEK